MMCFIDSIYTYAAVKIITDTRVYSDVRYHNRIGKKRELFSLYLPFFDMMDGWRVE